MKRFFAFLLVLALCLPLCAVAEELTPEPTPEPSQLDLDVRRIFKSAQTVGGEVVVAKDGEIVYQYCYGYANQKNRIAATPDHYYRLASVSKMVTAVAVMAKGGTAIALTDESGMMDWNTAQTTCSAKTAVPGGTWGLVSVDKWNSILSYNGGNMNSYTGLNTTITAAGGTALQEGNYWSLTEYYADNTQAYTIKLSAGSKSNETKAKTEPCRVRAVLEF